MLLGKRKQATVRDFHTERIFEFKNMRIQDSSSKNNV